MSDMNVQVTISAESSGVVTGVQQGSAALANLTAVAERMNATLQAGFAQTQMILRSMASAMGDVREAAVTDLPKVVPEVEKIEKATEKAKIGFGELGQKMVAVGMALSMSLTAPITAATYGIFQATKTMDSLKLSLTAVAGSADAMKRQLEDAKEIAKLPGLGMEEAMTGSIRLQSAGISAEQAKKSLMAFGNALATVGKGKAELDGVTLALSQIQSKGKVFAEEINQLNERLPQIRGAMKAAFGTSNSEDLQKLGVSSEEFISKVTAEFAKLPAVTSGLKNDMENLSDQWKMALADMGEGLKPFFATALQVFTAVAGKVAELGKWFAGLSESQRGWIVSAVAVAAALGPMLLGLGKLIAVGVEMKALWVAWTGVMEAWKVAQIGATVATEGATVATAGLRAGFVQLTATMMTNPYIAAAAAILAITMAVIGLKSAMDDLNAEEANSKAARSAEATAAQKKVEAYQHAYDSLSDGKEKDMVGRKLGLAKGERDKAFAKDDEFLKKGLTSKSVDEELGSFDKDNPFKVRAFDKSGQEIFQRAPKETKAKKAPGVSEAWKAELSEREKDFKDAQKLEQAQEKLRIESIVDEVEREREIRSSKYRKDIEDAQGNKTLLLAVNAKYAHDLADLDGKDEERKRVALKKEVEERKAALKKEVEDRKKAYDEELKAGKTWGKAWEKEVTDRLKGQQNANQVMAKSLAGMMDGVTNSLASGITGVITRTKSLTAALKDVGREILQSVVGGIVKAGLQWVEMEVMKATIGKAMMAASLAATVPMATAQAAIWSAPASLATIATFGGAAAAAPAAIAGSLAMTKAFSLPSFDVGTPSVPRDMVAQIHQGEMIIPKTFAEGIRKGEVPLGGASGSNHSASLVLPDDILAAIASKGGALVKIINNQGRVSFA